MASRATHILETLVVSMLTQDTLSQRKSPVAPAFVAASLLGLVGGGFLLVAGYDWLRVHYDLQTARLYMGGFALSLALLIFAVGGAIHAYKRKKVRAYYNVVKENIHAALNTLGDEIEEPVRENPKTAMLMAGMAGYIAAEKLL